jgi:hypothetical protein
MNPIVAVVPVMRPVPRGDLWMYRHCNCARVRQA